MSKSLFTAGSASMNTSMLILQSGNIAMADQVVLPVHMIGNTFR